MLSHTDYIIVNKNEESNILDSFPFEWLSLIFLAEIGS